LKEWPAQWKALIRSAQSIEGIGKGKRILQGISQEDTLGLSDRITVNVVQSERIERKVQRGMVIGSLQNIEIHPKDTENTKSIRNQILNLIKAHVTDLGQ